MTSSDKLTDIQLKSLRKNAERGFIYDGNGTVQALLNHIDAVTPRVITTVGELNSLPNTSVVRIHRNGYVLEKLSDGWHQAGVPDPYHPNNVWVPATVLHAPETGDES